MSEPGTSEPRTTTEAASCPNCGTPRGDRYCTHCGQDNVRPRLEAGFVLGEAAQNLVGWDSALRRTVGGLVMDPGRVAAEYVAGKRRSFVNPARFCLLALAAWLFLMSCFGLDPIALNGVRIYSTNDAGPAASAPAPALADAATEGDQAEEERASAALADGIRRFLGKNLQILLYLSLPLQALLLRLFFRSSRFNVAEALVLVLYNSGFGYLLAFGLTPLIAFGWERLNGVRVLVGLVWFFRALKGFYGRGWWGTVWRGALVAFLHLVATILLFTLVAVPWVLLFGA